MRWTYQMQGNNDQFDSTAFVRTNRKLIRACLSTFFFDRKCAVETKYSDLIGCDFNYRSLFRSWLRSRPIRSGFLFSTAHFRSKNKVLSCTLRHNMCLSSRGSLSQGAQTVFYAPLRRCFNPQTAEVGVHINRHQFHTLFQVKMMPIQQDAPGCPKRRLGVKLQRPT